LLPLAVVTDASGDEPDDRRLPMAELTLGANSAGAFWQVSSSFRCGAVAAAVLFWSPRSLFITPALVVWTADTMIGS